MSDMDKLVAIKTLTCLCWTLRRCPEGGRREGEKKMNGRRENHLEVETRTWFSSKLMF